MSDIYTSGKYLEETSTWHSEDSPWKAKHISTMLEKNDLTPSSIVEIGTGAGIILDILSKEQRLSDTSFNGYDISPQAIRLANGIANSRVKFACKNILQESDVNYFDVLLAIDVFEHVPDYMGFIEKCKNKAKYKIYHIPLDLYAFSVLRNNFMHARYTTGHLHYFTADSAIATLKDTGHEIIDCFYTNSTLDLFKQHPSVKRAVGNIPRWLFSKVNTPFAARVFGGFSLMVLAE